MDILEAASFLARSEQIVNAGRRRSLSARRWNAREISPRATSGGRSGGRTRRLDCLAGGSGEVTPSGAADGPASVPGQSTSPTHEECP